MTQTSQFEDADQLLDLLGSFWAETYLGSGDVGRLLAGRGERLSGTFDRLQDAFDCTSRLRCPVLRRERWRHLPARLSERNTRPVTYGSGADYGDGRAYGDSPIDSFTVIPAPSDLVDVEVICNRLTEPSAVLVRGLDFDLLPGYIRFYADPFDDDRFLRELVTENGETTDEEIHLWLHAPAFDRDYVYQHWGYVVGADGPSTEGYKAAVNAVYDMLTGGTSAARTLDALAACLGLPLAKACEVVEDVADDGRQKLVLTDQSAYRFPRELNATVAVGDILFDRQSVCDGLAMYELNRGDVPGDLAGLTLGRGLLVGRYLSELGFPNRDVPIETETVDGKLKVSWALGGHPADVEAFWNEVHARGLAGGTTLAQLLDRREEPDSEPGPENLPPTINPLEFLVDNLLRFNLAVVRVRVDALGPSGGGLGLVGQTLRLVPPNTYVLLLIEASTTTDALNHQGDGWLDSFDAADPVEHSFGDGLAEAATIRRISGQCQ